MEKATPRKSSRLGLFPWLKEADMEVQDTNASEIESLLETWCKKILDISFEASNTITHLSLREIFFSKVY